MFKDSVQSLIVQVAHQYYKERVPAECTRVELVK